SPAAARAHPRLPVDPARRRHHHHRALEQGRGHRRGLRPVEGGGGVTSRRVAFATLGCRLNQVDSQRLQAALEARGFSTVAFGAAADVVVVNTCTVTARAEVSDRQAIRRARRANPDARVVVTGCWAQTSAAEVARQPGVDLVVGNADKARLPTLLDDLLKISRGSTRVEVGDIATARVVDVDLPTRVPGRSRAFVKVQDGCQHRCAFCIVPRARGASRSLEPARVADQAARLVEGGHPEITLTGIDLGHYGADLVPRTSRATIARQAARLRALGAAKALAFRRALADRIEDVLVLETRDPATRALVGLTGHYVEVPFDGPDALMRRTARVRIGPAGRGELLEGLPQ